MLEGERRCVGSGEWGVGTGRCSQSHYCCRFGPAWGLLMTLLVLFAIGSRRNQIPHDAFKYIIIELDPSPIRSRCFDEIVNSAFRYIIIEHMFNQIAPSF